MKDGKHDIHKRHGIGKVQSVLVSKNLYRTEQEARDYIKRQGYDDSYKLHPDSTQQYWRFRQHKVLPGADYITKAIDKTENKAIIEIGNGTGQKQSSKVKYGMLGAGKSHMKFKQGINENYNQLKQIDPSFKQQAEDQDVDQQQVDIHRKGGNWLAKAPNLHNQMDWDEAHALKNKFEAEAHRKNALDELVHKKISHQKLKRKYK